jgi:hypothetical protein
MSSTRNKNTPGDYLLEQRSNDAGCDYSTYVNSSYGKAASTHYAGDGLLPGRIAPTNLSYNACDIESQLFGIGSTNLVNPKGLVTPDFKTIKSLNMIDKLPVFVPEALVVDNSQRPRVMN